LGVLNTWSAELLAEVPQEAWSAWLERESASTLFGASVVNAASGNGLVLDADWLDAWLAADSGNQLRDLAAGVFNLLPPESFADLDTAKLNALAGSTLAGIDSARWAAWLSAHTTPAAHAALHAHVLHALLQAHPQAVAAVLEHWLQGVGAQTLAQKTQRFATLDAAVLQAQWDRLAASFGAEWMAALVAWGQQQPNQLDQLGTLLVMEPLPLVPLRDLIANLGTRAQLSPEQWRILDERVELTYRNSTGDYVNFYSAAMLSAMPEGQRTVLAQRWQNAPEQATSQLPAWSAEQINLLPVELLAALRNSPGWINWGAGHAAQGLAAHVINAVGPTLWALLDTRDPDTGVARWSDWLEQAQAGHFLEQLSAAALAHILALDATRAGAVQDAIRAMDAAQWSQVAANSGSDLADLNTATVVGFGAATLNALEPRALGQLSTVQLQAWRRAGGSLLDLSTTTLLAMHPSVLQSTLGASVSSSAQAFTGTQWLELAHQRGLDSLGAQVTSQFSAALLNTLQRGGSTHVDVTLDMTPAQWFAWKVLHAQPDGSVSATGLSAVLQTRLQGALSESVSAPQWSEYQFARNAFSTAAQRAQYDQWVVGQGDLADMRDFVHAFTELSAGLAAADVQALAGLLAQAKDATGARGVLSIVRFVQAAYPDFSLHELAHGLADGGGGLGPNRVLDVLSLGAQEAGLDAAAFRADWASLLEAAPAGLTRLAMVANVTNTLASSGDNAGTKDLLVLDIRDLRSTQGTLREALAELRALPSPQGLRAFQDVTDDIVGAADSLKKFFDGLPKVSSLIIGVAFAHRHLLNYVQSGLERTNSALKELIARRMVNTGAVQPLEAVPQTIENLVTQAQSALGNQRESMTDLVQRVMKADYTYSNHGLRVLGERIFNDRILFSDQARAPGSITEDRDIGKALSMAVVEMVTYKSVLRSPKYRGDPNMDVQVPARDDKPGFVIPGVNSESFKSATALQLKAWATYLFGTPQGEDNTLLQADRNAQVAEAEETMANHVALATDAFNVAYDEALRSHKARLQTDYEAAKLDIETMRQERTTQMQNAAAEAAKTQLDDALARAKVKFDQAIQQLSQQLTEDQQKRRAQLLTTPDGSLSSKLDARYKEWLAGLGNVRRTAAEIDGTLSAKFAQDPERLRLIQEHTDALLTSEFLERVNGLNRAAEQLVIDGTSFTTDTAHAQNQFRLATNPAQLSSEQLQALEDELAELLGDLNAGHGAAMDAAPGESRVVPDEVLRVASARAQTEFEQKLSDADRAMQLGSANLLLGMIKEAAQVARVDPLELYSLLKRIHYNEKVAGQMNFIRNAYQGQRLVASLVFGLQDVAAQWTQLSVTNDQDEALRMRTANAWAATASAVNMPFNLLLSTIANREKNRLAGNTQSNAFLELLADYFPYSRSGWKKYKEVAEGSVTAWSEFWSCFEVASDGTAAKVITLNRSRPLTGGSLPTPEQMETALTKAFGELRAGQANKAYALKQGNELRWGLMRNTPAFVNDASQAVAAYYTWKYVTSEDGPRDFRSSIHYQRWAMSTVVGNAAMATTDLVLDAIATGHMASRISLWVNLVGNGNNILFGLRTAHGAIEARHASGVTNDAQYQIELSAFYVRAGLQTAEYGLTAAAAVVGTGPAGMAALVTLFVMPVISGLTMTIFGPDASGYQQAQVLYEYAKALGSEVDADIYNFLARRARWGALGANVFGGVVTTADTALFYEEHQIAANGNYIRRGAIERMQAFAQGKSLSSINPNHPELPSTTDTRMLSALTSVANDLTEKGFTFGELVFLAAVTHRFKIGSENYVDASGVFEFDYHPMQGAITQPSVTLDTTDMQATASTGWSGNGWAGNAASLAGLNAPEQGVHSAWFGISNGMSRNVYGLATVIKPHIVDRTAPAVVVVGRGVATLGNDYTGTIYVDARDLPQGSVIVLVNPAENNIKVITNGTPSTPQDLFVDAQNKDAAGPASPRPNARQVVRWSSETGADFMVNLDAFGDNLLLQGGKGNERLFGEANDLQYMYGGGDVTLTLSGSRNLMYVGIGANALLLGDGCSLQINSDSVRARVGQFVSYGTGNSLDFQSNVGGLVFENYAGIVDIRRNPTDSSTPAQDQGRLAQVRGFASLYGTQGRDRYVVVGVQAGTQQAVNLFGGDGENFFDINTSSGVAIALGAGSNTVNLNNALAISIETFPETATSAELFATTTSYASSSIYLRDYSYLTATLRGVDSVFMSDETESEAVLMVDGGIHTISLRGQELALYVDGTESSTTWVSNYLRDASGVALDTATRSQLVDIQGLTDSRIALAYDEAAKTLFLATFSVDGSLLSEISLSGNVDDDMVLSYDTVVRREGNGLALGSGLRSSVAASVLVDALAQADASAFMSVTDRQHQTRSMAWLYNIFAPA
jgi:hypothetical protein